MGSIVRLLKIPFLILLCAIVFAFLTGSTYEFTFSGLLSILESAPIVDFSWLAIPSVVVPGDPLGWFTWLIDFINILIDIVNFALMIVRGFLQLFTYIVYFVRCLFVPSM